MNPNFFLHILKAFLLKFLVLHINFHEKNFILKFLRFSYFFPKNMKFWGEWILRFRMLSVFLMAEKSMRNDPEHNFVDVDNAVSIFIDIKNAEF